MKLQPDSALSKRQLRRRKKLGISVPGVFTTNEDSLQADTLETLSKVPKLSDAKIREIESKSPLLAAELKARLERRKYRKEQKNG